jgi:hypothetical protein
MYERTIKDWVERIKEVIDEAFDDGYVILAESKGSDINLMVGYRYQDSDDIDLFVAEISV